MEKDMVMEGVPPEEGKFCADCKHLIGVRYMKGTEDLTKWRCGRPENIKEERLNLVTGIKKKEFHQIDIYPVRYNLCRGNWYEEYVEPERPAAQAQGANMTGAGSAPPSKTKRITAEDL